MRISPSITIAGTSPFFAALFKRRVVKPVRRRASAFGMISDFSKDAPKSFQ
jgi:hypothetical protein